ncbi:MAG: hypothetical protein ACK50L_10355 [Bacteroidota bacterium]
MEEVITRQYLLLIPFSLNLNSYSLTLSPYTLSLTSYYYYEVCNHALVGFFNNKP